jgi:putative membrane-bound dehydrogenase-like protein
MYPINKVNQLTPLCFLLLLSSCLHQHADDNNDNRSEHVHGAGYETWLKGPSSSPLSPVDALKTFQLQDKLLIETVAAEPLVQDPVLISFDARGRMWIAEMTNYMLDVAGTGERDSIGNIVILEDSNGDNKIDKRIVFLAGITLPRAITHVEGGILFADDNALYYVSNDNNLAGTPIVVDATYAGGANVEKKANGLLYGLNNWLYNAKSNRRYRLYPLNAPIEKGSEILHKTQHWQLVRAYTEYRGQWGISLDDYGRLYYSTNSSLLIAGKIQANASSRNPKIKFKDRIQQRLSDNKVYPNRPTLGTNRAYDKSKLNDKSKIIKATAVSGPVIYRGSAMAKFYGHAFSPEPAGNLVSAIKVTDIDGFIDGQPFYQQQEFLTSTDERFRPVNTYTAPDGSLYIVDMYRGIIQNKYYLTQYLSKYILGKKLDKGLHFGRIYRITNPINKLAKVTDLNSLSSYKLVQHLSHPNGWHRDTAKRLLIERQDKSIVGALNQIAISAAIDYHQINALWVLEGLNALTEPLLSALLTSSSNKVIAHSIELSSQLSRSQQLLFIDSLINNNIVQQSSYDVAMALAATLGRFETTTSDQLLVNLVNNWQQTSTIASLALTGLKGRERYFIELFSSNEIQKQLLALINLPQAIEAVKTRLNEQNYKVYLRGKKVYLRAGCGGCHGENGQGLDFAGPPLANSEWVTGNTERLTALLLHGLTGPVKVADTLYDPGIDMPGLKGNNNVSLAELTALIGFLRNSWGNQGGLTTIGSVNKVLHETINRSSAFTEGELLQQYK